MMKGLVLSGVTLKYASPFRVTVLLSASKFSGYSIDEPLFNVTEVPSGSLFSMISVCANSCFVSGWFK